MRLGLPASREGKPHLSPPLSAGPSVAVLRRRPVRGTNILLHPPIPPPPASVSPNIKSLKQESSIFRNFFFPVSGSFLLFPVLGNAHSDNADENLLQNEGNHLQGRRNI